jgi:GR25 family glycosyltransferase involved in LPS biosynthesis
MECLLSKLTVVNTRIEAIDGLHETRENIEKIFGMKAKRTLTMCEVCCTLSHLKAISSLRNVNGDYFMICEDDIVFDNIEYLNTDLETIIKNAPVFDILMLYKNKIWTGDPGVEYLSWKNEIIRGNVYDGVVCYIVTKECVSKVRFFIFLKINF